MKHEAISLYRVLPVLLRLGSFEAGGLYGGSVGVTVYDPQAGGLGVMGNEFVRERAYK